jgi:hypothetical protein
MTTLFSGSLTPSKETELLYNLIDARDLAFDLTKRRENDCAPDGNDCYTKDRQTEAYGEYNNLNGKVSYIIQKNLNTKLSSDELEKAIKKIKETNNFLEQALKKQIGAVAAVKAITQAISVAETVITKAFPLAFGQYFYTSVSLSYQAIKTPSSDVLRTLSKLIKVIGTVCEDSEMPDVARYQAKDLLSRLVYLQLFSSLQADVLLPSAFSEKIQSLLDDADAYSARLIDIQVVLADFEYAVREIEYGLFLKAPSPLSVQIQGEAKTVQAG